MRECVGGKPMRVMKVTVANLSATTDHDLLREV